MTNTRAAFSFPALFVPEGCSADDFLHHSSYGNGMLAPDGWTDEALECCEAYARPPALTIFHPQKAPPDLPTWLAQPDDSWSEHDVSTMIRRVVGSATAKAWHLGWFADSQSARHFYEDLRYLLSQRFAGLSAPLFAQWGYQWAYGTPYPQHITAEPKATTATIIPITHQDIDAVVSGKTNPALTKKWRSLAPRQASSTTTIAFSDTLQEWGKGIEVPAQIMINLFAFRGEHGQIPLERLRHATRLLTVLATVHAPDGDRLGLGIVNLPALLLSLGLGYDSNEARATALAVTSLITATTVATSAQLAALAGMAPSFRADRDNVLRSLRNLARASFGDQRDYEKLSILPAALETAHCPDLTLVATTQRVWREAYMYADTSGLRHTHHTSLWVNAEDRLLMSSISESCEAIDIKKTLQNSHGRTLITEALTTAGINRQRMRLLQQHLAGYGTLNDCPHINRTTLLQRGFNLAMIERLENYLPQVRDVRHAATPWVLGRDDTRGLGLADHQIDDYSFDLLAHLGFTPSHIDLANAYIYGHPDLISLPDLTSDERTLCATTISQNAHLHMAAAAQAGITGSVPVIFKVGVNKNGNSTADTLIMTAWRLGLKGLTMTGTSDVADSLSLQHPRPRTAYHHAPPPLIPRQKAKKPQGRPIKHHAPSPKTTPRTQT